MKTSLKTYQEKECFKCLRVKPLGEFYRHPQMADGRLNKCKECNKKDVRENRAARAEYYKEFDRGRAKLPHRISARKEYAKTEAGKRACRKARDKYTQNKPEKRAAVNAVNNAVRDGKLDKPTACADCLEESDKIHGHHEDYSKPLDVIWLCPQCHSNRHNHMDGDRWLETGSPWIQP